MRTDKKFHLSFPLLSNITSEELLSRTFNFLFIFVKNYFHSDKDNSVHNIGDIAAGCCAVGEKNPLCIQYIFRLRDAMLDHGSKNVIIIINSNPGYH